MKGMQSRRAHKDPLNMAVYFVVSPVLLIFMNTLYRTSY